MHDISRLFLGITVTYSTGVASNRTEIVRLATQVENLTITIKDNMQDRYRGADAARDFKTVNNRIDGLARDTVRLETELKDHIRKGNG